MAVINKVVLLAGEFALAATSRHEQDRGFDFSCLFEMNGTGIKNYTIIVQSICYHQKNPVCEKMNYTSGTD
jgi:hypothetical protein